MVDDVTRDYANYFYPYIKDQLDLSVSDYLRLYRGYARMGFGKYPMFHLYCFLGYALGERNFDILTRAARLSLGRSPQFGIAG